MPIRTSFLVTPITVLIATPVSSMPTVKQVQKGAQQQQNVRQKLHDMRPVFCPEKIGRDD